jgi:hypothetical protein
MLNGTQTTRKKTRLMSIRPRKKGTGPTREVITVKPQAMIWFPKVQ